MAFVMPSVEFERVAFCVAGGEVWSVDSVRNAVVVAVTARLADVHSLPVVHDAPVFRSCRAVGYNFIVPADAVPVGGHSIHIADMLAYIFYPNFVFGAAIVLIQNFNLVEPLFAAGSFERGVRGLASFDLGPFSVVAVECSLNIY